MSVFSKPDCNIKVKIFIVTYKNSNVLNDTLESLFEGIRFYCNFIKLIEIYIINNHSIFLLNNKFKSGERMVKVLHNVLRPDFSTGYLSRNWNQALILGFQNLQEPDANIVIACQDDTLFYPDWLKNIVSLHGKGYSFITYGWGDNFMSFTPEAVKQIGLFDERFIFSGVTSDYFLRALKYNKNKSSINDYYHGRILNEEKIKIADRPNNIKIHMEERKAHKDYGHTILHHKWNRITGTATKWTKEFIDNCPANIKFPQYIMYPYFEKDILTLKEQKILC
jgi:hypothetical protein